MRRNILIIISFLTLLVASGCTNLDEKWYSEDSGYLFHI